MKEWRDELKQNSDEEERVLEVATPAHVVLRLDRSIQVLMHRMEQFSGRW